VFYFSTIILNLKPMPLSSLHHSEEFQTLINGEPERAQKITESKGLSTHLDHSCNDETLTTTRNLPLARHTESGGERKWFERFFETFPVEEILPLATATRDNGKYSCRFGERAAGTYNVVIFIVFEDGVEWVVKLPQNINDGDKEHQYLMSEYATLVFLQNIDIPSPKVYGFGFDRKNPIKTPYFFMEKVSGSPFYKLLQNGLGKVQIYQILQQLALIKKILMRHPFHEIGSLSIMDNETCLYAVDRQLTLFDYEEIMKGTGHRTGPYQSSFHYYADLLHIGWSKWHDANFWCGEPEIVREQYKIHQFFCSILPSYVKDDGSRFFLAHTDLSLANIMVDEHGSITGIIDWEFASTFPFQAAEHYPLFLMDEENFVAATEEIYDNPLSELRDWREFYASQFDGDSAMEEYFENVNITIAFEKMLRDNSEATVENLVDRFKFLESNSTLDQIGLQFPWIKPTTARPDNEESSSRRDIAVQTETPKLSQKAPSIRLSSESSSLNDVVCRPSRFERFTASSRKKMRDVSDRLKDRLLMIRTICT
jgi:serine/threonine protein kinase